MNRAVARLPGRGSRWLSAVVPTTQDAAPAPTQFETVLREQRGIHRTIPVVEDVPAARWPYPGQVESTGVYIDPRPGYITTNPRPSVTDAAATGSAELVSRALAWEWVEEYGDGLGGRWDPTGQLCNFGVNAKRSTRVWVACPEFFSAPASLAAGSKFVPLETGNRGTHSDDTLSRPSLSLLHVRKTETALGLACLRNDAATARVLLQNTHVNPNLCTVYHDYEPKRTATEAAAHPLNRRLSVGRKKRSARVPRGGDGGGGGGSSSVQLAALPDRPRYSVYVSPLYLAIFCGHGDIVQALLDNPRTDPNVGIFADDPRSRIPAQPCSHLMPELRERERRLSKGGAGPRGMQIADLREMDWVAQPEVPISSDMQKQQYYSFALGNYHND
ncbi:hypothetical protein DIPPA_33781 [Diplonema papillatum]|nr:hypothetical protein DIPPA_33781 [Diplonema papillatum]